MGSNLFKIVLLPTAIIVFSCNRTADKNEHGIIKSLPTSSVDTSMIAVIAFNKSEFLFDSSYKAATLTAQDLIEIEQLIHKCIYTYNKSLSKDDGQLYGLQDGFRQYVATVNSKGEKEVWINCFCTTNDKNWKKSVVSVADGGGCYYNLKINLTTKKYYDLNVNGIA